MSESDGTTLARKSETMDMKTTNLIVAVLLATGMSASAVSQPKPSWQETRGSNAPKSAERGDSSLWDTMGAPFRYAGRAGMTVLRTPVIVGETIQGERKFISRDGLMERAEPVEKKFARSKR